MRKYVLLLLLFISCCMLHAQKTYRVSYQTFYNGNEIRDEQPVVIADGAFALITSEKALRHTAELPFQENIVDAKRNSVYSLATIRDSRQIATVDTTLLREQVYTLKDTFRTILGHRCRRAEVTINSNRIGVWFTADEGVYASPVVTGSPLGLVLEYDRNGDYKVTATKVAEISPDSLQAGQRLASLSLLDYQLYSDLLWKSRFTIVPVFENARLNFSGETVSNDSLLVFGRGITKVKKFRMPKINPGSRIFLELTQSSLGDAYDRTGTVFLIPSEKIQLLNDTLVYVGEKGKTGEFSIATPGYVPNLELMRFFTSFGAGLPAKTSYKPGKSWLKENVYRQDVTELGSLLSNQVVYLGVQIENYDASGHRVDVQLTIHNEGEQPAFEHVYPLFNTLNIFEAKEDESRYVFQKKEGLKMHFYLEKPLHNARIRFITTGHGGWGNGDEFLRKTNTIKLNGKVVFQVVPWREDCGSYRNANPKSGNFPNGLSSSDYSRSNWCPGTVTNPYIIELGALKKGRYELQLQIPQGKDEGPSFSHWSVSGALIGEE